MSTYRKFGWFFNANYSKTINIKISRNLGHFNLGAVKVKILFWTTTFFIIYTYILYPVGIWAFSRRKPSTETTDPIIISEWPNITVVVAVYNEQHRIINKIRNLQALDYDQDKLHILFVSDGSNDATNKLLTHEPKVELLSYPQRRGKPYALNLALQKISSEIIVFTDVRQELTPYSLRYLVASLSQPNIGAVSGELVHWSTNNCIAEHIGLYWRYEKWIRKSESRFASTIGATGALYAIHRADYSPLAEDTLLDDFEIPLQIIRQGKRVLLDSRAIIYDELQKDATGERKRKIRTLTGNFQAFTRNTWLFSPRKNPIFLQFISHKVFRLLVPYAMLLLLISSLFTSGLFYKITLAAQLLFYLLSFIGFLLPYLKKYRLISFATVFIELNAAAVLALFNYLTGQVDPRWEKT